MKKIGSICIGILFIIGLCTIIVMPMGKALVWVTPMKMLAEGNITTDGGFCEVEKTIILRNDGNDSVFVSLNATGIDVRFEENPVELKAGERKIIHPIVKVREGRHQGAISITGYEGDFETQGVGSRVISTMGITVTTIGTKVNSSFALNISESGIIILAIALPIGGIAAGTIILIKRKKSAGSTTERKEKKSV